MIYNESLINNFSQTALNLELLSFYNDWKFRYLRPLLFQKQWAMV